MSPGSGTRARRVAGASAIVVLGLGLLPPAVANEIASRVASSLLGECLDVDGLAVDLGSWPSAPRAATGRLRDVEARADTVTVAGLRIRELRTSAGEVRYPLGGGLGRGDASVRRGSVTGRLAPEDLEDFLSRLLPDVSVNFVQDRARLGVPRPLAPPIRVALGIGVRDGSLQVSPALAGLPIALPALLVDPPPGTRFSHAEIRTSGIAFGADIDRVGDLRDLGCDMRRGVRLGLGFDAS